MNATQKKKQLMDTITKVLTPLIDNDYVYLDLPYYNNCKHSKKCTFYTLRFGCSFAAVNTIKPQLL